MFYYVVNSNGNVVTQPQNIPEMSDLRSRNEILVESNNDIPLHLAKYENGKIVEVSVEPPETVYSNQQLCETELFQLYAIGTLQIDKSDYTFIGRMINYWNDLAFAQLKTLTDGLLVSGAVDQKTYDLFKATLLKYGIDLNDYEV